MSEHFHAAILAGGSGVRFWPLGRRARPKQFLSLLAEQTLLQQTVDRCGPLIPPARVWIVTGRAYAAETLRQLPELPPEHLIEEPCGRNTAPCIGLAAVHALHADPQAVLACLPADHAVAPPAAFQSCLATAREVVAQHPRAVVLLGAIPTGPSTGFGYIERGDPLDAGRVFRVQSFHEKPPRETAQKFVDSGRHYWNCGIFVLRADRVLDLLREHQPGMARGLETIAHSLGTPDYTSVLNAEFPGLPSVSIDKGVIELADDVFVVPATFEWADVGTWQALGRHVGADADGNTVLGLHAGVETQGCIVRAEPGHLVATVGLRDCVIVHTPDATLVARKDDEEGLRKLVALLKERGLEKYI